MDSASNWIRIVLSWPLSRFGTARQVVKDRIIAALQVLFDRYKGIGD